MAGVGVLRNMASKVCRKPKDVQLWPLLVCGQLKILSALCGKGTGCAVLDSSSCKENYDIVILEFKMKRRREVAGGGSNPPALQNPKI